MISEKHPWLAFIPDHARILFVGTFPPVTKRWSYPFFYPNKANFFWRILAAVAGKDLSCFAGEEAVEERKKILTSLGAGITDMGLEIIRKNGNSLDENIVIIQYMDILDLLDRHRNIQKIIFTSSSGPVSAARCFEIYLQAKGFQFKFPRTPKPIHGSLQFQNRCIAVSVVLSPSPRAANHISFEKLVEMYAHVLKQ